MKQYFYIISCLSAFYGFAQRPEVSLSSDVKSLQVGENIVFTVRSNIEGQVTITFPDEFVRGYGNMNGMEQRMDYQTGRLETIFYFSQNGIFKENGKYELYAYVNKGNKVYKSNPLKVSVEKDIMPDEHVSAKVFNQPVFGVIRRSKAKIYEGEALILESKVYSRVFLSELEAYNSFELVGRAEQHHLDQANKLYRSKELYKGEQFYTMSKGKQVLFISEPGKYKIKPFEMILQYDGGVFPERFALTSLSSSVEVLALPADAPTEFIGGVGQFEMQTSLDKSTGKVGDVLKLKVVISGQGNLHNLDHPQLNLPKGVVLYGDPEIDEQITFALGGAAGKINYCYNLQLLTGGEITIPPVRIAYFDPKQEQYVKLAGDQYELNVVGNALYADQNDKTHVGQVNLETVHFLEDKSSEVTDTYATLKLLTGVTTPIFLALLGGFFYVRKKQIKSVVGEKTTRKKTITELLSRIEDLKKQERLDKNCFLEIEHILKSTIAIFPHPKGASYSKEELLAVMKEHEVPNETITRMRNCLIRCEEARYTFLEQHESGPELLEEAQELIQTLA